MSNHPPHERTSHYDDPTTSDIYKHMVDPAGVTAALRLAVYEAGLPATQTGVYDYGNPRRVDLGPSEEAVDVRNEPTV